MSINNQRNLKLKQFTKRSVVTRQFNDKHY